MILDIWVLLPDSSFAELYDEVTVLYELRQAYRTNDVAVAIAYGFEGILDDKLAIVLNCCGFIATIIAFNYIT